jgi:hypothetical protein
MTKKKIKGPERTTKDKLPNKANGTMERLQADGLQEINRFLREDHPERIFVVQTLMKEDRHFLVKDDVHKNTAEWLHPTIVYWKFVPKGVLREVLLSYLKKSNTNQIWTDDIIKMIDKKHAREGIFQMTEFLGSMAITDRLDPRLHYKPLLKAVLLAQFKKIGESVTYTIDMLIAFGNKKGIYQLDEKPNGVYKTITHVRLKVSVPIPKDCNVTESWTLENNHSWKNCRLRGLQVELMVSQVFEECNQQENIQYEYGCVMKTLTDENFPAHAEAYYASAVNHAMSSNEVPEELL